jgi:hypothetical protein
LKKKWLKIRRPVKAKKTNKKTTFRLGNKRSGNKKGGLRAALLRYGDKLNQDIHPLAPGIGRIGPSITALINGLIERCPILRTIFSTLCVLTFNVGISSSTTLARNPLGRAGRCIQV